MERAAEAGMEFNSEKCAIKHKSISFFGNMYTDGGIKPDPAKIRGIQKMPTPQNKDKLHRFLPRSLHAEVCRESAEGSVEK